MERTVADPQDGRQRIPALSRFEEEAKFTRAIRVGDRIIVAGNVASGETAGEQATRCFEQIVDYIQQLGGQSGDVVRVRMFVTSPMPKPSPPPSPRPSAMPVRPARWSRSPPSPRRSSRSRSRPRR